MCVGGWGVRGGRGAAPWCRGDGWVWATASSDNSGSYPDETMASTPIRHLCWVWGCGVQGRWGV